MIFDDNILLLKVKFSPCVGDDFVLDRGFNSFRLVVLHTRSATLAVLGHN